MSLHNVRTDTFEAVHKEAGRLTVGVSRKRDEYGATISDICVYQRTDIGNGSTVTSVWEIPAEHSREFIQALIDAHQLRDKWEREGTNWNLGEEGV